MNIQLSELAPDTTEPLHIDTTLPLPPCSAFAAALSRIVADARFGMWLSRFPALSNWRVSIDERPRFERPGLLDLWLYGASVCVVIDLAAFPALDVVAVPAADVRGDTSESLRVALVSTLLAPLIAALATAGIEGVTIGALRVSPAGTLDAVSHVLSFTFDGMPICCALLDAQPPWFDALTARLKNERLCDIAPRLARVHLPGRVRLGSRPLSLSVLRGLKPGDVLLGMVPVALGAAPVGPLHAWWGARRTTQWHATVLIEGTTMTMTEVPNTAADLDESIVTAPLRDHAATDHASELPADFSPRESSSGVPESADLGGIDLPVHAEIDTLSLSIAELAALRPGYVLELPVAARDVPVRLVTYGQMIGSGKLVAVGAHLGVQIDRMAGDDGSV